jgi:hypothetical protein
MAQFLEMNEIRNYPLSNGTTVDLVALIDTTVPTDWRAPVIEELAVGQVAYVSALGEMRRGVITKLGRTKVHVTFTTRGAIDHQARYRSDAGIRVQTTAESASAIRVAPLSTPERVTKALLAGEEIELGLDQELETPAETAEREAEQEELEGTVNTEELATEMAAWEAEGGSLAPTFTEPAEEAEQAPAPALDPITGSAIVEVLEETWAAIRANHPDLPHVVIVTGSGFIGSPRWAHWRESGWTERQGEGEHAHTRHGEMFVAGEGLAKGAKHVVESMLHEGAHALATERSVQDTSRQGRWHNGEFRKLAAELGLEYTKDKADPTHGYSFMTMTAATEQEYAELIKKLDTAIRATIRLPGFVPTGGEGEQAGGEFVHGGKRPKTKGDGSSTNYLKLTCKCIDDEGADKPRVIRASKREAERGLMMCGVCRDYFEDRS